MSPKSKGSEITLIGNKGDFKAARVTIAGQKASFKGPPTVEADRVTVIMPDVGPGPWEIVVTIPDENEGERVIERVMEKDKNELSIIPYRVYDDTRTIINAVDAAAVKIGTDMATNIGNAVADAAVKISVAIAKKH